MRRRCCCGGGPCPVTFNVKSLCGDGSVPGAAVTLYDPVTGAVVDSATSDGGGLVVLYPPSDGSYVVGVAGECGGETRSTLSLACGGSKNVASNRKREISLIGFSRPCATSDHGGYELTIGGQKVTTASSGAGLSKLNLCGGVYPLAVTGPGIPDVFAHEPTVDLTGCAAAFTTGLVTKPGFACCEFAAVGVASRKVKLTDCKGDVVVTHGGYSPMCGGEHLRLVTADHVAPQNPPGYHNCGGQPYPDRNAGVSGSTSLRYEWYKSGAGWACKQSTPHRMQAWDENCEADYYVQCSRVQIDDTALDRPDYYLTWTSTSYTINSDAYPCSITFHWSQAGDYDIVRRGYTGGACPNTPYPICSSMTLTELDPSA